MKSRNTIILLCLTVALFAAVLIFEHWAPSTREAWAERAQVMDFDRDDVNAITIQNNDDTIELRLKDGSWLMTKPVGDRADRTLVTQILGAAGSLGKFAVVDLKDTKGSKLKSRLKTYGVYKARVRLKLSGAKPVPELLFGKDTAVEGKVYVQCEGGSAVFVVENELRGLITKPADEFRDHKLHAMDVSQALQFTVKSASGEIEMKKEGDHWEIRKPVRARGDDRKITSLIAQFANIPIEEFVTDTKGTPTGLGEPRGTVSLVTEGTGKPAVLDIGQPDQKDPAKIFARFAPRDSFYKLPKAVEGFLALKPNDVRDQSLGRLDTDIVDRVGIEVPGRPRITLIRDVEKWLIGGEPRIPANRAAAERLLRDFQGEKVVAFVDDVASDRARYGLDRPSLKVTFSSYASENTPESPAGERPFLTVLFGKTDGGKVYAMVGGEPFILAVRKEFVTSIPAEPVLWRDLQVLKMNARDIVAMEVKKADEPPVALRRDGNAWRLEQSGGDPAAAAVESVVSTLANLRAARWAAASEEAGAGLEKSPLAVRFVMADKTELSLHVGVSDPDGMFYATLGRERGVFLLGRPDVEVLKAGLFAPAPAAAPPPAK